MRESADWWTSVAPGSSHGTAWIEHNPLNPATQWTVKTCELDGGAVLLAPWRLLAGTGAEAVELKFLLFTPFKHRFFRRLDGWLSWLPLGAQCAAMGTVPARPGQIGAPPAG